jgi:hypothetical protein
LNGVKKGKKKGEKPYVVMYVSVYIITAVVMKTQLEVPDNRLCNVVTLSGCATQMRKTFSISPARAKCERLI